MQRKVILQPKWIKGGATSLTTTDGRAIIMMPHQNVCSALFPTCTDEWENSPWMRMFENARKWSEEN